MAGWGRSTADPTVLNRSKRKAVGETAELGTGERPQQQGFIDGAAPEPWQCPGMLMRALDIWH